MALSRPYVEVRDGQTVATNLVRALAVVAAAFVLGGVFAAVGASLFGADSTGAGALGPGPFAVINALSFVGFGAAAVGFVYLRKERGLIYRAIPTGRDLGWALVGLAALLVAYLLMSGVVQVMTALAERLFDIAITTPENSIITRGKETPVLFLYMVPVSLLFVGPAEELLFRGTVQGLLRDSLGVVPGIALASLLFGLGHYFAVSGGNPLTYIFITGSLGLVLGALYEHTETIAVPAVVHGIWNAGVFLLNYYIYGLGGDLPV